MNCRPLFPAHVEIAHPGAGRRKPGRRAPGPRAYTRAARPSPRSGPVPARRAAAERPGWLGAVIDYHASGAYGQRTGAAGFEGYIRCLEERQRREIRILAGLGLEHYIAADPQRDWAAAEADILAFLKGATA